MDKPASLAFKFLSLLFEPYPQDEGLTVEIRTLDGPEPLDKKQHWFGIQPQHLMKAAEYCFRHREATNLYMGVLPREGRTDSVKDCPYTAWLWCDIDCGMGPFDGPTRLLRNACIEWKIPDPSIIICSGVGERDGETVSGLHCYWRLETVEPLFNKESRDRFKSILQRLCQAIGGKAPDAHGDSSGADIARILRPAGTLNHKQDVPRPVIPFIGRSPALHSLDWWEVTLPPPPAPAWEQKRLKVQDGRGSNWHARSIAESRWAFQGYQEGERHKRLASDSKFLANECGLSPEDGREILQIKVANSPGSHPVEPKEIDGIVNWAWRS